MYGIANRLALFKTHVYGQAMTKRLTKSDWLEHGLKKLVKSGVSALKAEPMAKSMNVSRGSFYWHFKNIDAFHSGVLDLWKYRTTVQTIVALENTSGATDKLFLLIQSAFTSDPAQERAVRAWSLHDTNAAQAVALVDDERVQYIEKLLVESGVNKTSASARATFLYWAYLGQLVAANRTIDTIDVSYIEEFIRR